MQIFDLIKENYDYLKKLFAKLLIELRFDLEGCWLKYYLFNMNVLFTKNGEKLMLELNQEQIDNIRGNGSVMRTEIYKIK